MKDLYNGNGLPYGKELEKGEYVIFSDGSKHGHLEARWNDTHKAFINLFDENGDEREEPLLSNEVIKIDRKKRTYNKQNDTSKMKEIFPCGETEKAYQLEDGSNGCISRGNMSVYYRYIAKSICIIEGNKIYAPIWS